MDAYFDFHRRKLMEVGERRPFAEYFPEAHRAQVSTMVGYLRDMFRERITKLDRMDAPTEAEAIAKLNKVVSHIATPSAGMTARASGSTAPTCGNQKRILDWNRTDRLKKLAEGTRDSKFPLNPQDVNAGYIAALNSVTFPAGILQPPYFDPAADPAVNFGAVAAVTGHEFGHGFDDQGSRSDGGWQGARLVECGLARRVRKADRRTCRSVQRSLVTESEERRRLLSDPHSPGEFRVNGIVRNVDAWYDAFGVKPGKKLYLPPERRIETWRSIRDQASAHRLPE